MSATPQPKFDLTGAFARGGGVEDFRKHLRKDAEEFLGEDAYIMMPWLKPGLIEAAEARGEWPPPHAKTYGAMYLWAVEHDHENLLVKEFERFFAKLWASGMGRA